MSSDFKNFKEALQTACDALDYIKKWKPSFATEDDDWEDFKREEQIRDAIEEEKEKQQSHVTEVTIEEVRTVLAEISRSGKTAKVKELLTKYNSSKLSEVKKEDLKQLLKDAKEID